MVVWVVIAATKPWSSPCGVRNVFCDLLTLFPFPMHFRNTFVLLAISAMPLLAQTEAKKTPTFEGSASLGYSETSGNSRATTTNVVNKLKYTLRGWSVAQDLAFYYGEANDKVNANFWNGGFRGARQVMPRLGFFVATRFDRNQLQGISSRFEEGVGADIKIINAENDKVDLALGASWFQQQLTPGSSSNFKRTFPAARAAMDYRHRFTEKAFFYQSAEYLPNLANTGVYLMNTESTVTSPLVKRLGIKITYVVRYNSQPPVRDSMQLKRTDTFFSSGVTYSF